MRAPSYNQSIYNLIKYLPFNLYITFLEHSKNKIKKYELIYDQLMIYCNLDNNLSIHIFCSNLIHSISKVLSIQDCISNWVDLQVWNNHEIVGWIWLIPTLIFWRLVQIWLLVLMQMSRELYEVRNLLCRNLRQRVRNE